MATERKAGDPWNEQTFFSEAEARSAADAAGLRLLFESALSFEGGLDVIWGAGDAHPRFMIRRAGARSGELLSGWASGGVGVQVGSLRDLLGVDAHVLDELSTALRIPGWLDAKEPGFDAALLERADVSAAVSRLLAAIADLGRAGEPRCWALFANPRVYRIDDAVRERVDDTWVTAGRAIHVGDRVIVWRGRGKDGRRGIVALGEVVSEPKILDDSTNPYWTEAQEPKPESRVRVRYVIPPGLPLWLDEHEEPLGQLSVSRAKGGTVFNVTDEQWNSVVEIAGGWPLQGSSEPTAGVGAVRARAASTDPAAWLLLTFGDERQYAGNQGYEDDPARVYRYDSFVPNHRQLVAGDAAVLKAPDRTLGCARIERIEEHDGTKERQRCPECKTTAIKTRRTAKPIYRCDAKHEFDVPIVETVACRKYAAHCRRQLRSPCWGRGGRGATGRVSELQRAARDAADRSRSDCREHPAPRPRRCARQG